MISLSISWGGGASRRRGPGGVKIAQVKVVPLGREVFFGSPHPLFLVIVYAISDFQGVAMCDVEEEQVDPRRSKIIAPKVQDGVDFLEIIWDWHVRNQAGSIV